MSSQEQLAKGMAIEGFVAKQGGECATIVLFGHGGSAGAAVCASGAVVGGVGVDVGVGVGEGVGLGG